MTGTAAAADSAGTIDLRAARIRDAAALGVRLARAESASGSPDNDAKALSTLASELGGHDSGKWHDIVHDDFELRERLRQARDIAKRELEYARLRENLRLALAARERARTKSLRKQLRAAMLCAQALHRYIGDENRARLVSNFQLESAEVFERELQALGDELLAELWDTPGRKALRQAVALIMDTDLKQYGVRFETPADYHKRRRELGKLELTDYRVPWMTEPTHVTGECDSVGLHRAAAYAMNMGHTEYGRELAQLIFDWCEAYLERHHRTPSELLGDYFYPRLLVIAVGSEPPFEQHWT